MGEDCYFFIKASCRNGDNCAFRHCKEAILTQDTCKEWMSGQCHTLLCPKRHPQLSTTPICKFENSPTGCLNRNCTFRHVKSREPTQLPTALVEVLKKSAPSSKDVYTNGTQGAPIAQTYLKKRTHTAPHPQPNTLTRNVSPVTHALSFSPKPDTKPVSPPPRPTNRTTTFYKPKPEMEPAPIPIVTLRSENPRSENLRSENDGSSHHASSTAMSNLKVLTTHSDIGFYDRRNNSLRSLETNFAKKKTNDDPLKSPPSPITFHDKPKRSPITFNSDPKATQHTTVVTVMDNSNAMSVDTHKKRPHTLIRQNSNSNGSSQPINSPLGESAKPPVKRVKIRVRRSSSLLQQTPEERTNELHTATSTTPPILSPLDSGAFPSYSSDDFRIEDQIEDLINANFSPKHGQTEEPDEFDEMHEIQDTDDIFLEFENLIS